jgi:hypothetical protein
LRSGYNAYVAGCLASSKRGASVSVGCRGAHVTVGTHGVRETVGIPGTGLSYTATSNRGHSRQRKPQHVGIISTLVGLRVL